MGCDRISELPDSLVGKILSYLPTKDSVKTSLLSKGWQFLWLRVLEVDLDVNDFPLNGEVFASFMDKFLEYNHKSRMQKFKIKYNEFNNYRDRFVELISTVVDRGIQHLDVEADMYPCIRHIMPQNIYKSKTLVSLKLVNIALENPNFCFSIPNLKIMHLQNIYHSSNGHLFMENLISSCHVLEDLTVVRPIDPYNVEVLMFIRVRSQSLKTFRFTYANNKGGTDFLVEIDAPQLKYMSFKNNRSARIVVKNLSSLFMVDIDIDFGGSPLDLSKGDTICDTISEIYSVRRMIISQRTLEVIFFYLRVGPIPEFCNLHCLQAASSSSLFQIFLYFLECCPNLNNLILDFTVSAQPKQIELKYVPRCLFFNLECVEIKELIMEEDIGKKVVRYFLENSKVLEKLILRYKASPTTNQVSDISKELLTFKKSSPKCQIIIH